MDNEKLIDSAYDTAITAAVQATEVAIPYWPNPDNPRFDRRLALEVIDKGRVSSRPTNSATSQP